MKACQNASSFLINRETPDVEIMYAQMAFSRALAGFNRASIPYGDNRDKMMHQFGLVAQMISHYWASWTSHDADALAKMAVNAKDEARELDMMVHRASGQME